MSTALTVSDRAAEIVAWVESFDPRPTPYPGCIGEALVVRRVEVHTLDAGAFEAIRAVGREHWSYHHYKEAKWLAYEPSNALRVVLFRE